MEKLISDFSVGLFLWQTVLFILLVVLLKKYAWGPILQAIYDREEGIKDALESAENAKKEMQSLNADNERILAEAKIERDTILKEARELKESIVAEAKNIASQEADKVLDTAREQIENEKNAAVTELKNEVAKLSIEIAEKILKAELQEASKQKALVDKAINDADLN